MINLIFEVVIILVMLPLIITPKKVVDRPACKIKNPAIIRGLGIAGIIVILLMHVANFM